MGTEFRSGTDACFPFWGLQFKRRLLSGELTNSLEAAMLIGAAGSQKTTSWRPFLASLEIRDQTASVATSFTTERFAIVATVARPSG